MSKKCLVCDNSLKKILSFPNGRSVFKCSSCKLRSLRPLPTEVEARKVYQQGNYFSEKLKDLHKDLTVDYQEGSPILQLFQKHVKNLFQLKKAPAKLLEIGCARGVLLDLMRKAGYDVQGIELDVNASKYAEEKFKIKIHRDPIEKIVLEKSFFDLIVAFDVIEHILNPRNLIRKARQFLKKDGFLVLGTPTSHSLINYVAEFLSRITFDYYYYPCYRFYGRGIEHLNIFDHNNLSQLLDQEGFDVIGQYLYAVPVNNMCDVNLLYKSVIRVLSVWPYEFVLIAKLKK